MKRNIRVAMPPPKPLLIFDGDCNFCKYWVARWKKISDDSVDYLPSQNPQIARRFPEIPREEFQKSVQFIETNGQVYSGAQAALRSRAKNPRHQTLLNFYNRSRIFAFVAEKIYHLISSHREFFSWLWGTHP